MAENFYTILTVVGHAKIANSQVTGEKVELTEMAVGDGNGSYYNPTQTQTELRNEVWRGNIASITVDENNPNWIVIEGVIPSSVGGFFVREVGIFDAAGDMIAIGKYPETYKPVTDQGSAKDLYIRMIIEVTNASAVQLKIDPSVVIASRKYVDDKVAPVEQKANQNEANIQQVQQNLAAHLAESTQNAHLAKNIGIEDTAGNFTATDVEGALAELFQSVSDGKDLIGGAITDVDPSIVIPPYPTFQQLADAIRQISTGKKWASGIETSHTFMSPELDFVPNIVIVVANRPITNYAEPGAIRMRGWNNSLNFIGASPPSNLYINLYPAGHMYHKRFFFSAGNYQVQEGYLWYALE